MEIWPFVDVFLVFSCWKRWISIAMLLYPRVRFWTCLMKLFDWVTAEFHVSFTSSSMSFGCGMTLHFPFCPISKPGMAFFIWWYFVAFLLPAINLTWNIMESDLVGKNLEITIFTFQPFWVWMFLECFLANVYFKNCSWKVPWSLGKLNTLISPSHHKEISLCFPLTFPPLKPTWKTGTPIVWEGTSIKILTIKHEDPRGAKNDFCWFCFPKT